MATPSTQVTLIGLARRLVVDRLISESEAARVAEAAAHEKLPLVSYLVRVRGMDASAVALSAAQEFGLPLFDLDAIEREALTTRVVGEQLLVKHHALPLGKPGTDHGFLARAPQLRPQNCTPHSGYGTCLTRPSQYPGARR